VIKNTAVLQNGGQGETPTSKNQNHLFLEQRLSLFFLFFLSHVFSTLLLFFHHGKMLYTHQQYMHAHYKLLQGHGT
jgi:hypothetical protein